MTCGGRGGIRTHGALAGTPVFKTGALNRSATLPSLELSDLAGVRVRGKYQLPLQCAADCCIAVRTDARSARYPSCTIIAAPRRTS
jgi:hypothetical protein